MRTRIYGVAALGVLCAALFYSSHSSAQGGQSFPGFVKTRKGDHPVPNTNVGIHTFGGVATSGQGDFEIKDTKSKLVIGDYYTLYVEGWVIFDPYVHEPGGTYLLNPAHNKLAIKVAKKGSPELLSDASISNIVLEKVATLKPESKASTSSHATVSVKEERDWTLSGRTIGAIAITLPAPSIGRTLATLRLVSTSNSSARNAPREHTGKDNRITPTDGFLQRKATEIGFSSDVLTGAIKDWSVRAQDPYQLGLASLYEGRYVDARDYLRKSIANDSKEDNPYFALASAEFELANYSSAESIYRELLGKHPRDPLVLNNLAVVLMESKKLADVDDLLNRALLANGRLFQLKELYDSYVYNNLGVLHYLRSDSAKAETFFKRALELKQRVFGAKDPDTATTMNNLALVYGAEDRFKDSEQLQKEALTNKESALGPDNTSVAASLDNLGLLYTTLGRYSEAEPLLLRAVEIRKRSLVSNHPEIATTLRALGNLYLSEERYSEAEPLFSDALGIDDSIFGSDNLTVAADVETLGVLYYHEGKFPKAEPLLQSALATYQKLLPADSNEAANVFNNLGIVYRAEKKYDDAEAAYCRSLRIREKIAGSEASATSQTLNSIGNLYISERRFGEAKPILKRALAIRQKTYGPEHPLIASTLHSLAELYYMQGQYANAESLCRQALVMQEKFGSHHARVAEFATDLAATLRKLNRDTDAQAIEEHYEVRAQRHP